MATFALIHGAGSDSWYWHLVVPILRAAGHDVVAPDLPVGPGSGVADYADTVVAALGDRKDVTVVGQSLGGFTAPIVADRVEAGVIVLVAAMVPAAGESPGEWWANTGWDAARRDQAARDGRDPDAAFDPRVEFFHDVPEAVTAEAFTKPPRAEGPEVFDRPWPMDAWPAMPTRFLLCRHDRFFPAPFLRRVVADRLGIVPDEMDGGHLPALARPDELASYLLGASPPSGLGQSSRS